MNALMLMRPSWQVAAIVAWRMPQFLRQVGRAYIMGRSMRANLQARAFLLIVGSTVIAIAGTDLVLPAVPQLPKVIGGDLAGAQLVLASFTAGAAVGLLLFGEIGARFDQRWVLVGSLMTYAIASWLCTLSGSLDELIALRFIQGIASSAAAVLAPGFLRGLYGDTGSVSALGALGSIESLVPAFAPLVGVWLLRFGGWRASFQLIALLALIVAGIIAAWHRHLPKPASVRAPGGYARLLRDRTFLRYAVSHACTLGALLVFVFGAPTVMTAVLSGTLTDFIFMQCSGIACFVVASNLTGVLVRRFGAEKMIWWGTSTTLAGGLLMLTYALAGGHNLRVVTVIFLLLNTGLALRGPPGFHRAIVASRDDARGAALTATAILLTVSAGTACIAPFITYGLVALALGASILGLAGVILLRVLPGLEVGPEFQQAVIERGQPH
jgi:DHA1 family bicyclomycin/chloramphenicol resistance-like MFS transporter